MKKIFFLLLLSSTLSFANRWEVIGNAKSTGNISVDRKSYQEEGDYIYSWVKFSRMPCQFKGGCTVKLNVAIDCSDGGLLISDMIVNNIKTGGVIYSGPLDDRYQFAGPDTVGEQMIDALCAKKQKAEDKDGMPDNPPKLVKIATSTVGDTYFVDSNNVESTADGKYGVKRFWLTTKLKKAEKNNSGISYQVSKGLLQVDCRKNNIQEGSFYFYRQNKLVDKMMGWGEPEDIEEDSVDAGIYEYICKNY